MRLALKTTDQHGLTLLEMMVVLSLLAGLAAMVVPNFIHTTLSRYRLKHAGQRLVGDMLYARMRAVATNHQYRIVLDSEKNAYWIEAGNRSSSSTHWQPEGGPRQFSTVGNEACFPGVQLVSATAGAMTFKPTGGQTNLTVTLEHSSGSRLNIRSSIAGRIRMEYVF